MPTFVLGLLLLLLLFYELSSTGIHWFPAAGYVPFTASPGSGPTSDPALDHPAPSQRRRLHPPDALLDARRARRGLHPHRARQGTARARVVFRHGLRAALTPIVTQFGIDVGVLFGGAVITESVFGMPGLGYTAVQAITNQDLPVIIGIVIVASAAVVVANIVVDFLYAVLDPRVRLT